MARTAMFCRIPVPGTGTKPLPGPGSYQRPLGLGSGGGDRSGCRRAFSPAVHTFLRALPSHKGQLLEFPSASLDPGRAEVEGEEMASSDHEGDGHWGITGPTVTGRVTLWLLGRERQPRLPLGLSSTPTTCPRPTTKCCAHQARNQLNI